MGFKRRRIEARVERQLLTGMIVNEEFLRSVRIIYKADFIQTDFIRIVAAWCLDYLDKMETCPGKHITDLFETYANSTNADSELVDMMEEFLQKLSDDYASEADVNYRYILSKVEQYFRRQQLLLLSEDIKQALDENDLPDAEKCVLEFTKVELPKSYGIDVFRDPEQFQKALDTEALEPVIRLPGSLGRFLNSELQRSSLVGIMGVEKIGKTFILMDMALHGRRQHRNILFVQAGDMTEMQQLRRLAVRITGKNYKKKYQGKQLVPVLDCLYNQLDSCDKDCRLCDVGLFDEPDEFMEMLYNRAKPKAYRDSVEDGYKPCAVCQRESPEDYKGAVWYEEIEVPPLDWRDAFKAGEKLERRAGRKGRIKMLTYPNSTFNVTTLEMHLDMWEQYEGWIPDAVFGDYPDIFAPEPGAPADERGKQNATWKALRRVSQERDFLVVVPTQADAAAYDVKSLSTSNFSEDKRKYSHVTTMATLNQTQDEKYGGILRIGTLMRRDEETDRALQVKVLQRLVVANPLYRSFI